MKQNIILVFALLVVLAVVNAGTTIPKGVVNPTCGDINSYPQNPDPKSAVIYCFEGKDQKGNPTPASTWTKLALGPVALQGTDVSDANATLPSGTNSATAAGWEINLSLTSTGAKAFQTITGKLAWATNISTVAWLNVRNTTASTYWLITRAKSGTLSREPRPTSWPDIDTLAPPNWAMAV